MANDFADGGAGLGKEHMAEPRAQCVNGMRGGRDGVGLAYFSLPSPPTRIL